MGPRHSDVEAALKMSQGHRWREDGAPREAAADRGSCMSSVGGMGSRRSARSGDDWSLTVVLAVRTDPMTGVDSGRPDWTHSRTSTRIWICWGRRMRDDGCIDHHRVAGRCYHCRGCHERDRDP